MTVALDKLARPVRDLRISVTDRCNFRCVYCMPKEVFGKQFEFLRREQLLTFEEIERLTRTFAGMGVEKLRITGGEPLVRRGVDELIARLAAVPGIADVTLTTNGSLLARMAQRLADAGLDRVTVSLDSLDDATFRAMNDVDFPVAAVLEGIEAALAAGLRPVKVNMVVKRGTNDDGILAMAERFRGTGVILRFIEYMDVGATNGWQLDEVVPSAEIVTAIDERWPLEPVEPGYRGEVASRYRYRDGARRDRPDLLRHAALLPRLHARAPGGRRQALHLPLRRARPRPPRTRPQRAVGLRARREAARPLARARRPLLGAAHGGHGGRPAQGRDVAHRRLKPLRRGRLALGAGAGDEQLDADVLAERPLVDVLASSRRGSAGTGAATCACCEPPGGVGERAGRGSHQGHFPTVRHHDP